MQLGTRDCFEMHISKKWRLETYMPADRAVIFFALLPPRRDDGEPHALRGHLHMLRGPGVPGALGGTQLGHHQLRQLFPLHADRVSVRHPGGVDWGPLLGKCHLKIWHILFIRTRRSTKDTGLQSWQWLDNYKSHPELKKFQRFRYATTSIVIQSCYLSFQILHFSTLSLHFLTDFSLVVPRQGFVNSLHLKELPENLISLQIYLFELKWLNYFLF